MRPSTTLALFASSSLSSVTALYENETLASNEFKPFDTRLHQNVSLPTNGDHLFRRWYGVQAVTTETDTNQAKMPNIYAWPTTCNSPKTQPVRYCYKDARSAKNLGPIVDGAIAAWGQATRVTALNIELAAGCGGDPMVLCSDDRLKGERDALVISDESRDNDAAWNLSDECQTQTTVGYRYAEQEIPYRHKLRFCPLVGEQNKAYNTRTMTHELGHAIGLQHEHQRPDRDKYIKFWPRYLVGYAEASAAVDADAEVVFDDEESQKTRMRRTTSDYFFARRYFPNALEHLKGNQFDDPDWRDHGVWDKSIWDTFQWSDNFDYNSIMMYDGTLGSNEKGKYVLTRVDNGEPTWMGGGVDSDPATTKISEGDIARIAQVYDAITPECEAAKKGTTWGALRVKVRDNEWVEVPPPRMRDEALPSRKVRREGDEVPPPRMREEELPARKTPRDAPGVLSRLRNYLLRRWS